LKKESKHTDNLSADIFCTAEGGRLSFVLPWLETQVEDLFKKAGPTDLDLIETVADGKCSSILRELLKYGVTCDISVASEGSSILISRN